MSKKKMPKDLLKDYKQDTELFSKALKEKEAAWLFDLLTNPKHDDSEEDSAE